MILARDRGTVEILKRCENERGVISSSRAVLVANKNTHLRTRVAVPPLPKIKDFGSPFLAQTVRAITNRPRYKPFGSRYTSC